MLGRETKVKEEEVEEGCVLALDRQQSLAGVLSWSNKRRIKL